MVRVRLTQSHEVIAENGARAVLSAGAEIDVSEHQLQSFGDRMQRIDVPSATPAEPTLVVTAPPAAEISETADDSETGNGAVSDEAVLASIEQMHNGEATPDELLESMPEGLTPEQREAVEAAVAAAREAAAGNESGPAGRNRRAR